MPSGWEWIGDWKLDKTSVNTADGWVYAPNLESLKWPESYNPIKFVNHARQRRWVRKRKWISGDVKQQISVGLLKPGDTVPLPLSGLTQSGLYYLQLRPSNLNNPDEYSWSSVAGRPGRPEDSGTPKECSEICVSTLTESDELLCCPPLNGTSSNSPRGLWFCLGIQATEIAKDIRSDPIQDWTLVVKSPLSITNFLPMAAEFSVFEMQASGHYIACSRGIFGPGKTVRVYDADIRNPLYFSLFPQRGWLPIQVRFCSSSTPYFFLLGFYLYWHEIFLVQLLLVCFFQEAILISHPSRAPCKTMRLRSSISGRFHHVLHSFLKFLVLHYFSFSLQCITAISSLFFSPKLFLYAGLFKSL